jgi:hypothetical protein
MAIWFKEFPLSYAQERGRGTLIEHLGIELLEAGEDYRSAWQRALWSRAPRGAGRS